jgi:hypothetical protein
MSPSRKPPRASAKQPSEKQSPASAEWLDSGGQGVEVPEESGMPESPSPSPDRLAVRAALAAAGLLGAWPDDADLPTDPAECAAMERDDEAWLLATFTRPIGLSAAVIEDRR